jgi:hypothetical protein
MPCVATNHTPPTAYAVSSVQRTVLHRHPVHRMRGDSRSTTVSSGDPLDRVVGEESRAATRRC